MSEAAHLCSDVLDKIAFSGDNPQSMPERVNTVEDHPAGKFANRTMVRTVVFQILYQEEQNPGSLEYLSESYIAQELPRHAPLLDFAKQLLTNTLEHREAIDAQLTALSQNWTLVRMSPTDRSILRLGASEILYTDTPKPIVINEAVELAKKFGTKDSAAFVNGILDRVQPPTPPAEECGEIEKAGCAPV
jgi:N utilization substance protein B